jgi:D-glycero-D-manno-heptose 1,7-bisphosphate phosphatase
MKNRALFIDRDGVVNEVILKNGSPCAPWNMEEFKVLPDAPDAIRKAKNLGLLAIICTNQPDVPRGFVSREDVEKMHLQIKEKTPVDDIFVCLHDDIDNCDCRKPKPGMLIKAAKKWDIELSSSFFVGDTWKDISAGKGANCKTFLIKKNYNKTSMPDCDFAVDNLSSAVELISTIIKKEDGQTK